MVMERPVDALERGLRKALADGHTEVVNCETQGVITAADAGEVHSWLDSDLGTPGPAFSLLSLPPALVALGVPALRVPD
jgi:hypothetical protein